MSQPDPLSDFAAAEDLASLYEEIAEKPSQPSDEQLKGIANIAAEMQRLERQIAHRSKILQDDKDALAQIQTRTLPEAMQAVGMKKFTLLDGSVVEVSDNIYSQLSQIGEAEAFDWLESTGNAAIIKQTMLVDFPRAANSAAEAERQQKIEELSTELQTRGLEFDVKKNIHASTLKAFVKRQVEAERNPMYDGPRIPRKPFGIFEQPTATIKPPRKGN